ncbi:MAG: GNAT family N-acetyltransferase [Clostridia bacterium]|nr:GNAT family N-acetyltransferase [Clostridia bacterium]
MPVGTCCIFPENGNYDIGYCISKDHWKEGLGTEVIDAIIRWVKTEGGKSIAGEVADINLASIALLHKFGFDGGEYALSSRGKSCKEASCKELQRSQLQRSQLGFGRLPSSRPSKKQEASRENELVHFPVCSPAFSCALCAQVGQLCWPARERVFAFKLPGRGNCLIASNWLSPPRSRR